MKRYYLCITPFFPSEQSFRGPFIYDQVKAIERNSDYKVVVLMPTPFYSPSDDYEFEGVKVYRFTDYNLPSNLWPNRFTDYLSIRSLFKTLRRIGIDLKDIAVAHGHVTRFGMWANALKRRNPNIVSVVQHHGFDVMTLTDGRLADYDFHKRHCLSYGTKICNEADLNIGVSKRTLDYVKAVPGINLKREYVLYNGVDLTKFNPGTGKKAHGEEFVIGCVANFWNLKDQITLIKAVDRLVSEGLTNIKVFFVGTGYTRQRCEEYISAHSLGDYFQFIDSIPHAELPDFYRGLDLFVLPSYWEAFGCVYTEAYACGVPFIGVKGQGISEYFDDDAQKLWLVDPHDEFELSILIKREMIHPMEQKLSNSVDINLLISNYIGYISNI